VEELVRDRQSPIATDLLGTLLKTVVTQKSAPKGSINADRVLAPAPGAVPGRRRLFLGICLGTGSNRPCIALAKRPSESVSSDRQATEESTANRWLLAIDPR